MPASADPCRASGDGTMSQCQCVLTSISGEVEVRLISLGSIVLLMLASHSAAQTWDATTYLQSGAPSSCPKASATYGLSVSNDELVARNPSGAVHRSPITADGVVNMRYDSGYSRIGWITIAGNVQSKTLTMTASAFPGCLYALSESAPSSGEHACLFQPGSRSGRCVLYGTPGHVPGARE